MLVLYLRKNKRIEMFIEIIVTDDKQQVLDDRVFTDLELAKQFLETLGESHSHE